MSTQNPLPGVSAAAAAAAGACARIVAAVSNVTAAFSPDFCPTHAPAPQSAPNSANAPQCAPLPTSRAQNEANSLPRLPGWREIMRRTLAEVGVDEDDIRTEEFAGY